MLSLTEDIDDMIKNYPHLLIDDEISPMIRRMCDVEKMLKESKARTKSKDSFDRDEAHDRFANKLAYKILTTMIDRSMYQSIARLERGKQLLGIRTN